MTELDDLKLVRDVLHRGRPMSGWHCVSQALPGACLVFLGVKGRLVKPAWDDYLCIAFGLFVIGLFAYKYRMALAEQRDLQRAKEIVSRLKEEP